MASAVTLITYHRIATPGNPDLADSLIDAYPPDFEAQMRYLANRYTVIAAWDLVRALREDYRLPARALIITFDDGYRCFRDTALPVLRRLGLPVTLFVPTAYPGARDRAFWWDAVFRAVMRTTAPHLDVPGLGVLPLATRAERAGAYDRLVARIERAEEEAAARLVDEVITRCAVPPGPGSAILDWDELAALAAEGVAIGPHTRHHPILSQATPERVRAEVAGSWADLQARIPRPLPIFCYPNGKPHAIGPVAVRAVREAGLVGACTMVAGLNVIGRTDPYLLFRVGMEAGESLRRFAFKLTGAARVYRRAKALLRPAPA
jgi:peptidoglycan/xylan/chitin deacetylase (PgdA/CDA1 family)